MISVYVYVLDTLADWEPGYVLSELNSGRFFKEGAAAVSVKTVSCSNEPVRTMGGLKVVPDCLVDDVVASDSSILILPGAETWGEPKHGRIIEKAGEFLSSGAAVCAICGATAALAGAGLLEGRPHTSNGPGFLEMVAPGYGGQSFYLDEPSVADGGLITAGSTGALLWAKQILEYADVFKQSTLESWYDYFRTGNPRHFFALMETLPAGSKPGAASGDN